MTDAHKAALRYVDALIWTPAAIGADGRAGSVGALQRGRGGRVDGRRDAQRRNKIAVSLAADAPRVPHGTERYLLGADGQPVYS